MPLDPDTQYYAMGDNNAGAQPGDIPPDLSTLLQGASAQEAPAAGQGLPALFQLIAQLTGKHPASPAPLVPSGPLTPQMMTDPGMSAAPSPGLAAPDPPAAPNVAPAPSGLSALSAMTQGAPAPNVGAGASAAPLTMPTMPKHNDTLLKVFGALSALAGGSGGRLASDYVQQRTANEIQQYNQQTQAYQQQQQTGQQQAENSSQLTQNLAKLDPASQQQRVEALMQSPGILAVYGTTPDQMRSQFFNADGSFKPVGAADKPEDPVALFRAQTAARASLSQLSAADQQRRHDSFKNNPDGWEHQTGLPFENWTPSETMKNTTAAGTLAERIANDGVTGNAKMSDAQTAAYKTLTALAPGPRSLIYQSYANDPQGYQNRYGVPYAAGAPGGTEANATALQGVNNRETDAQRTAANNVKISKLNIAARAAVDNANNEVTMRGQDLRQQLSNDQINARVKLFNLRYGQGTGNNVEKQYQQILQERMKIAKRRTELSAAQKDAFGDPALSLRDQGRIDANGNVVANPAPTAAYQEYTDLGGYDQQLAQQGAALLHPAIAAVTRQFGSGAPDATVQFGAPPPGGTLPPAPVKVNPQTVLQKLSTVTGPSVPALPTFPAFTSHGSGGQYSLPPLPRVQQPAASAKLTPAQIHGMTTAQLLQRLAAKYKK